MTVKFEFTMSDVDAENLVGAVRDSAVRCGEDIMAVMASQTLTAEQKAQYIRSYQDQREYILGLIAQMTNTRVE